LYRTAAGGEKLKKIAKMKRCARCKERKTESEFGKKRQSKDGLKSWCKKCESEYSHKYYRRNREDVRKQQRKSKSFCRPVEYSVLTCNAGLRTYRKR